MIEITGEYEAPKTDDVEECKNQGCVLIWMAFALRAELNALAL